MIYYYIKSFRIKKFEDEELQEKRKMEMVILGFVFIVITNLF